MNFDPNDTAKGAQWFTEEEAAAILKMTPDMLARRRRAGKIAAFKDGRAVAYCWDHLEAYRQSCIRQNTPNSAVKKLENVSPSVLIRALRKRTST